MIIYLTDDLLYLHV